MTTRTPSLPVVLRRALSASLGVLSCSVLLRATDVIVDNADSSGVTITGAWTPTTNPGFWDTNTFHDGNTGKGTKSVRFTPNLPTAGDYEVFFWRTASGNRATDTPVDIAFSAGTAGFVFADAVKFPPATFSPFGISMAASSKATFNRWAPAIANIGVKWVRGAQGINNITPSRGTYNWVNQDALLSNGASYGMKFIGFIVYNASWINSNTQTFPTDNLPAWGAYVTNLVNHCKDRVRYWEVGNEPPNYTSNGTPAQYAQTMITAYDAAKAADPTCMIGLAAKSNHVNWLHQTILAGAADHFDFITLHPYEVLDSVDYGFEAQYMSIVPRVRKMLADINPAKVNVPIIFTEVGQPIGAVNGSVTVTTTSQASNLIKAYAMGIAQGVTQIDWFEGRDGDSGAFGLLRANNTPRPSLTAMSKMIEHFGHHPEYLGWVLLNGQHYGFVFQGENGTVMAAWAKPGTTSSVNFGQSVQLVNPVTGTTRTVSSYSLTNTSILVLGVPSTLVAQAQANKTQPFPWDGNFSTATSVIKTMPDTQSGLHQYKPDITSTAVTSPYGAARYCDKVVGGQQKGVAQYFTVDPNFLSYTTEPIEITVRVRRNAANDAASIKLVYESLTSSAKSSSTYAIPGNTQWYDAVWTITDAQFNGYFAYNFYLSSSSPKYYIQSVTVRKLNPTVNFSVTPLSSYGSEDSVNGSTAVQDAGATLLLTGNVWKKIRYPYTFTANTRLEFDFKAGAVEGEIQAIGVDTDNVEAGTGSVILQLHGTQVYQNQTYNTYSGSGWVHYNIPIGALTTGAKAHLLFISVKDASPFTSETYSRNVTLHE